MYMATRGLLHAWKDKNGCDFHLMKNRPSVRGTPSQPSEGTQSVWIPSRQLYGSKHCNVQQVIPVDRFGAFTLLHLPNKNYRRIGRKGRMGGNRLSVSHVTNDQPYPIKTLAGPSSLLLTALQVLLEIRKRWPAEPAFPYKGIQMEDRVDGKKGTRAPLLQRRMREFHAYVKRGGVLSEDDMTKTALIEEK